MNENTWSTHDRNPSEPGFRDWTNLFYDGKFIHQFDPVLTYRLTNYLNSMEVGLPEDKEKAVEAFEDFDKEAQEICKKYEKKFTELEQQRSAEIKEAGWRYASDLDSIIRKSPIFRDEEGWWFVDECWNHGYGPFESRAEAQTELARYYAEVVG